MWLVVGKAAHGVVVAALPVFALGARWGHSMHRAAHPLEMSPSRLDPVGTGSGWVKWNSVRRERGTGGEDRKAEGQELVLSVRTSALRWPWSSWGDAEEGPWSLCRALGPTAQPGHSEGGPLLQACLTRIAFLASWKAGPWTPCSASCGGGSQSRSVYCVSSDGAGGQEAAEEAECAGLPGKPPSTQACNLQRCAAWSAGPWGEVRLCLGRAGRSNELDLRPERQWARLRVCPVYGTDSGR